MMDKFPNAADLQAYYAGVPFDASPTESILSSVEGLVDQVIIQCRQQLYSGKHRISTSVSFVPCLTTGLQDLRISDDNDTTRYQSVQDIRAAFDAVVSERVDLGAIDGDIRPVFTMLTKDSEWLLQADFEVLFRKDL